LLWRLQATPHDREFSQEDQKDRRRAMGVALPPAVWCCVYGAESRGELPNLLNF
jgi:hypothetical protein